MNHIFINKIGISNYKNVSMNMNRNLQFFTFKEYFTFRKVNSSKLWSENIETFFVLKAF